MKKNTGMKRSVSILPLFIIIFSVALALSFEGRAAISRIRTVAAVKDSLSNFAEKNTEVALLYERLDLAERVLAARHLNTPCRGLRTCAGKEISATMR